MYAVLQYLAIKHMFMTERYVDEKGRIADCHKIANEIYDMLVSEGKFPFLAEFSIEWQTEKPYEEELVPLRYNREIERDKAKVEKGGEGWKDKMVPWKTHFFCCCDGLAFDPIMGEPVPIEEYSTRVFGRRLPHAVVDERDRATLRTEQTLDQLMAQVNQENP